MVAPCYRVERELTGGRCTSAAHFARADRSERGAAVVLGLSQARLARLSGLSRATINQLETGTIVDLGAAKLIALLDLLGLTLDAAERPQRNNALALASRIASVSYKEVLTPEALTAALVDGQLPANITPQVATLLDEAPLPLIIGVRQCQPQPEPAMRYPLR